MTGGEPINPYAAPVTTSEAVTAEMILQGVLQSVPHVTIRQRGDSR